MKAITLASAMIFSAATWTQEDVDRYPVRVLAGGRTASAYGAPQNLVIKTDADFNFLWANLRKAEFSDTPAQQPKIDFAKEMVIAAFYGKNRQIQSRIQIVKVERKDNKTIVQIARAFRGGTDEGSTYPYHVVAVPRLEGDIVFQEVAEPKK